MKNYRLTTKAFQITAQSYTEAVELWAKTKYNFPDYGDVQIISIEEVDLEREQWLSAMIEANPELVDKFEQQIIYQLEHMTEKDPKAAFASGMLILLTAFRLKDGSSVPMQIAQMHTAVRNVGKRYGWIVKQAPK